MNKFLTLLFFSLLYQTGFAQVPASWQDYVAQKEKGLIPELVDYSFAGYHFSERDIPDVTDWKHFNVVDYGAVADDGLFDDEAIQLAIDDAEAYAGPAVVFFPTGRFLVSEDNDVEKNIRVSRDSIVIKGSGAQPGGTEIFMKEMRVMNGHWQFLFEPISTSSPSETIIAEPVARGEHAIVVEDASSFRVGDIILISHQSEAFATAHFQGLPLSSQWTRLFDPEGMRLYELHEIKSITGKRISFVNPVQADIPMLTSPFLVHHYSTIQEVGIEDVRFTSNWSEYPEDFVHHKDDIHDYAWNAVQFQHVRNGWIRNCEFESWNQSIDVRESIGVTIENVSLTGKKGHASFLTRRSFGLLVKDCEDLAGQYHGPGTGYSGVNTVYLRHSMLRDISVDSHSGQPYATLIDDVDGGVLDKNGGPHESYPHHGQNFTFWNYRHKSTSSKYYDFWDAVSRNGNTYANPKFVGFQADTDVEMDHVGLNEMEGVMVEPRSLFEAQLSLRLDDSRPEVIWVSPAYGDRISIGDSVQVSLEALDANGISKVKMYINGEQQRELITEPYTWGNDRTQDPDLYDLSAGIYSIKVEAVDVNGNSSVDSIQFFVGQAPTVEFLQPLDQVIETGTVITVEANAMDDDGMITSVALFIDDALVSVKEQAPFRWENESPLNSLTSGTYELRLVTTDDDSLVASVDQSIRINDFPEVTFTSIADGDRFPYQENVLVIVDASDSDGHIQEVRLYLDDELVRTERNPPYEWGKIRSLDPALFEVIEGMYELKAVAQDDLGSETQSEITFIVNEQPLSTVEGPSSWILFPNPFEDRFSVQRIKEVTRVRLLDAKGVVVYDQSQLEGATISIDTQELPNGLYFVELFQGSQVKMRGKVVKN